jgi:hypothetical protein
VRERGGCCVAAPLQALDHFRKPLNNLSRADKTHSPPAFTLQ